MESFDNVNIHSAVGSALGYYYQAIYALICLFDSKNDEAFVSIETFDDVYHEDGVQKTLHQLKHKTINKPKISIKDTDLWKTLRVWCDYLTTNDANNGYFTLSTVAEIDNQSELNVLKTESNSRDELEIVLLDEANRVINKRIEVKKENEKLITNRQPEKKLPYESKIKACIAFRDLNSSKRKTLLRNTRINTSIFTIDKTQEEVIERIKVSTQAKNLIPLAESIIAWWDREAVRSLTRERQECIYFSELQEFIAKKNTELYNDGFTDDIDDMELPPPDIEHPIHKKQLEIINATDSQKRRSFNTEVKARIQRNIWMSRNLPSVFKLKNYDKLLVDEWSYKFESMVSKISHSVGNTKEIEGRSLLDWSHEKAHKQVKSISRSYDNPDLIRGSYQVFSKDKRIGWHPDYIKLFKLDEKNDK